MTTKPIQHSSKASTARPVRKSSKGAAETARLFINVGDVNHRPPSMPLTRYVE